MVLHSRFFHQQFHYVTPVNNQAQFVHITSRTHGPSDGVPMQFKGNRVQWNPSHPVDNMCAHGKTWIFFCAGSLHYQPVAFTTHTTQASISHSGIYRKVLAQALTWPKHNQLTATASLNTEIIPERYHPNNAAAIIVIVGRLVGSEGRRGNFTGGVHCLETRESGVEPPLKLFEALAREHCVHASLTTKLEKHYVQVVTANTDGRLDIGSARRSRGTVVHRNCRVRGRVEGHFLDISDIALNGKTLLNSLTISVNNYSIRLVANSQCSFIVFLIVANVWATHNPHNYPAELDFYSLTTSLQKACLGNK